VKSDLEREIEQECELIFTRRRESDQRELTVQVGIAYVYWRR
jgi:hypothetical protein